MNDKADSKESALPFPPINGKLPAVNFYPVFLNLRDARAMVVGAGRVAERKLRRLLDCGARVIVVAPEATPQIVAWSKQRKLRWLRRKFRAGDLNRRLKFTIAATDDARLNARIAHRAMKRNILINTATGRATGDVILPAVTRLRGGVTVAISTGGRSPRRARRLREEMERRWK